MSVTGVRSAPAVWEHRCSSLHLSSRAVTLGRRVRCPLPSRSNRGVQCSCLDSADHSSSGHNENNGSQKAAEHAKPKQSLPSQQSADPSAVPGAHQNNDVCGDSSNNRHTSAAASTSLEGTLAEPPDPLTGLEADATGFSTSPRPISPLRSSAGHGAEVAALSSDPDMQVASVNSSVSALRRAMLKLKALEEFQQAVSVQPEVQIDVFHCAVLIARHARPELQEGPLRQQLQQLTDEVKAELPPGCSYPMRICRTLASVLSGRHGFRGNMTSYYEADNSCIDQVLERKTGLPITLCLVYSEVARGLGLSLVPVNLPAHLMLAPDVEDVELLVDPFHGGEVLTQQDAEERLSQVIGIPLKLDAAYVKGKHRLRPRALLLRMLNNLKHLYATSGDLDNELAIIRYMRTADPSSARERREEALCLFKLKRYADCAAGLKEYLELGIKEDAVVVQAFLEHVRGFFPRSIE